ncbi:DUF488 domain-containing protein [Maritalea mediterranea]|uniref:DUF488 domain-containing protein n=1 Tax=Maritalea mediterranea TaxID=2909667 RepID=A0ABS9E4N4_9HYPH|nr:DUF488 domain-containing protein [Maritalea mediterranea]MCF4097827.1 DUF488 domain-containing protein [Maritalea mediterranea]
MNDVKRIKLFNRQKLLLALLKAFGGELKNVDFQKYLFLFTRICEQEKSFDFVPYRYGCFSFQSYADRRKLKELGVLEGDSWKLSKGIDDVHIDIDESVSNKVNLFADRYRGISGKDLIREVYKKYPYYAINSEIADEVLNPAQLLEVQKMQPSVDGDEKVLFTIGYEGGSIDNYLNRLVAKGVSLLIDVRKNPISRKYGFSKRTLSDAVSKLGVDYLHIPELGINSVDRKSLNNIDDYKKLFDKYEKEVLFYADTEVKFILEKLNTRKRVAVTCFEADHCMCHRSRVANSVVAASNYEVVLRHI